MDDSLRQAKRAAVEAPGDRQAQARLAILERRDGRGIQGVEPEVLCHVLTVAWVSGQEWAAIRVDFVRVAIVRPGKLHELPGFAGWMAQRRYLGEARVARADVKERHSSEAKFDFELRMLKWLETPALETHVPPLIDPDLYPTPLYDHQLEVVRSMNVDSIKTARTKEVWSIEHVRLACGMDPIEPQLRSRLVSKQPTKVGVCEKCKVEKVGRLRENGRILCWDCK